MALFHVAGRHHAANFLCWSTAAVLLFRVGIHLRRRTLGTSPPFFRTGPSGRGSWKIWSGRSRKASGKFPEHFRNFSERLPKGFRKVGIARTLCFCYVNRSETCRESFRKFPEGFRKFPEAFGNFPKALGDPPDPIFQLPRVVRHLG